MKTTFYFFFLFLFSACIKDSPNATPCPYLVFQPPELIPGTQCSHSCLFVYEGVMNFSRDFLEINCKSSPLTSEFIDISLDTSTVFDQNSNALLVIRIRAPKQTNWCEQNLLVSSSDCDSNILNLQTSSYSDINELQIWLDKSVYDCYSLHDIEFRLTIRNSLFL